MDKNSLEYKVGQRIRSVRLSRKMNQSDLAFGANISLPHVSDIERGKKEMQLNTFYRIIEALQVSADEILRPDTPAVNQIYSKEFSDLLADCSPTEIEAILKIVGELKTAMRSKREEDN